VDDGTLVDADGVSAELKRGFEVIGGGLASFGDERAGLKENIGASAVEPLANVTQRMLLMMGRKSPTENG